MANTERDLAQDAFEHEVRAAFDAGDQAGAATLLIEQVGPKVLAFLLHRLGNASEVSEVFSMFSEDLWRSLPDFEWRCSVRGYCFALARSASVRFRLSAHQRAERRIPLSNARLSSLVEDVRERTLTYLRTETKTQMQALFAALPEDDRALLQLRLDQQLGFRELALVLEYDGVVPNEVELTRAAARQRKRFQLVRERLRRMAQEAGMLPESVGDDG
jgi:RNA polymerase sigma factor (sigma-70 family)